MQPIEKAYQLPVEAILDHLQTDAERGLSTPDAKRRLLKYGRNELEAVREKSLFRLLLEQFISPLVWVLLLAAGLAFLFQDWLEGIAILVVLLINAAIGFFMEWQARRSMEALRRLSQSFTTTLRDGIWRSLPTTELVPGDLIKLEAGDMVPADCRIVEEERLGVKEAALTGESTLVEKQVEPLTEETPLHDRRNEVFKGTIVTRGNTLALVIGTGEDTELGAIAHLVRHAEKEATPLDRKLHQLSQRLLWLTLLLAGIVLLLGVWQGQLLYEMTKTAVALAVAAIPEGLPIVATIALARGMLRLSTQNVIVKKLSAVETLGQTEVIFTDKTGTLTENRLRVDTIVFPFDRATVSMGGGRLQVAGESTPQILESTHFQQLCRVGVLCNNAVLTEENEEDIGDPLEVALLRLSEAAGYPPEEFRAAYPRIRELPFDSEIKMMGTLHRDQEGYLACIKGAVETVLPESDYVLNQNGAREPVDREWWEARAEEMASVGLRILALAYGTPRREGEDFFHHLILLGIVGFLDPPREEVRASLQTCSRAGVRVVMVTGDHPETARHIALRTGLLESEEAPVIRGGDLPDLIREGQQELLMKTPIFARVSPAQKLDLIKLYQENGYTVGMTGDGVNDTPALKKADIGIAMGQRGTEAAKEVADLILEDDAFSSIVLAIRQGRGIFDNIRYFVIYLLSCNLTELLVVAIASLSNLTMPLLPLQILFLNMVTDVFPALALGMNREGADVMQRPPRRSGENVLTRRNWRSIIVYALGMTAGVMGALLYAEFGLQTSEAIANNLTFYTLIFAQLWHVFNLPDRIFNNVVTKNPYIWMAILLCLLITAGAYWLPVISEILQLQAFSLELLGYALVFSFIPMILIQFLKLIRVA